MESPLDILSRAAGMVSNTPTTTKRKLDNQNIQSNGGILKKALIIDEQHYDDDQPLDFSCKKKSLKRKSEENLSEKELDLSKPSRRPSVIYYATPPLEEPIPTKTIPLTPIKKRQRYTPVAQGSNSSSSSSPSSSPPPPPPRRLKRKKQKILTNTKLDKSDEDDESRRIVLITSKEDNIDEHFRRSLGDKYLNIKSNTHKDNDDTATDLKSSDDQDDDESVSVDDHFAKALGSETWSRINSVKPTTTTEKPEELIKNS